MQRGRTARALVRVPPLLPLGTDRRAVLPRAAGLPGLQHGGGAVAAAPARHHHAETSLMAGWHEDPKKTNATAGRSLRELITAWWRRISKT